MQAVWSADFSTGELEIVNLGAAIGIEAFINGFVNRKVQQWIEEVKHLPGIAHTQSHAAYSAFICVVQQMDIILYFKNSPRYRGSTPRGNHSLLF